MPKVLVVDDDLALADILAFTLRRAGLDICMAHDGRSALALYEAERPDLIVLDWSLPELDGLAVCRHIRAVSTIPIIMLTVHSSDDEVVAALEAGADEYVAKPFSPRQFVARVQALLRRVAVDSTGPLRAGELSLDLSRREAYWTDHRPIRLTTLEARLLQALMQNADQVLTAECLIMRIWGPGGASREMLKQLVHRLRNKIEPFPKEPRLIETVPGVGYVLNTAPAA